MVPPTDLCAVISDMREAQEYVFRVVAVNKAGRGEWSEKSDKIQKMMKSLSFLKLLFHMGKRNYFSKFV